MLHLFVHPTHTHKHKQTNKRTRKEALIKPTYDVMTSRFILLPLLLSVLKRPRHLKRYNLTPAAFVDVYGRRTVLLYNWKNVIPARRFCVNFAGSSTIVVVVVDLIHFQTNLKHFGKLLSSSSSKPTHPLVPAFIVNGNRCCLNIERKAFVPDMGSV